MMILNKSALLIFSLLTLFACLPAEESHLRGQYDSTKILDKQSAYHTYPYQCLVALDKVIDPDSSDVIKVGGSGSNPLCLPSNELSYLVKATKPTQTTSPTLKIAVLLDSSYSLQKTDKNQQRFVAIKRYLLGLFDAVQDDTIKAKEVKVSFFPFKYCSHADFDKSLIITKDDSKQTFESKVDALIGKGNKGNDSSGAAQKIKQLADGSLVPKTLKEYGAYGATNYLQAFDKAQKHLSIGNTGKTYKHIVIFSDGLPLTFNDTQIATYNVDASNTNCKLPSKITDVEDNNWLGKDYSACVLGNSYPGKDDNCKAPTSSDAGITSGLKAHSDPMNHLLGMIQHNQQINKVKKSYQDLSVYAVHLKNCTSLPAGEKYLCDKIAKPFFTSFVGDSNYFVAQDAKDIAAKFKELLQEQIKIEYEDKGKVNLQSANDDCSIKSNSIAQLGASKKYQHSYKNGEGFSFLKAQRLIKVSSYKGKAAGKKGVEFVKNPQSAVNLGLPHQDGMSLTTVEHSAGQIGEKTFKICSNFEYKDSCVAQKPTSLNRGRLEVHEYTDSFGNKVYCVLPKPVVPIVDVTATIEPEPEEVKPVEVDTTTTDDTTVGIITVDEPDEETPPETPPVEVPNNPPANTNTGTISVVTNPPPPQLNTEPKTPNNKAPVQSADNNPGQNSGISGASIPAAGIKLDSIPNWHVE